MVQKEGQKVYSNATDLVERVGDTSLSLGMLHANFCLNFVHNRFVPSAEEPSLEEKEETLEKTKEAIEAIVGVKVKAAKPVQLPEQQVTQGKPTYIRYRPDANSMLTSDRQKKQERIIRMVEAPVDPLEPPKFRHKKVPAPDNDEAQVPVMHAPAKKLTAQEIADWKIPPCVSNWKNAKGYTVPLDKRLAADGRGLAQVSINDKFAKLSESLYIAENQARAEVQERNRIKQHLAEQEKRKKEEELRDLAAQARIDRANLLNPSRPERAPPGRERSVSVSSSGSSLSGLSVDGGAETKEGEVVDEKEREKIKERERLRIERKRERERELKLEAAGKKTRLSRDKDRDISERIALGMSVPKMAAGEAQYDARLFNQSQGLDSGTLPLLSACLLGQKHNEWYIGFGDESDYNVYSKPLFNRDSQKIYRPKADDTNKYGTADEQYEKIKSTDKFRPARDFAGVDRSKPQPARTGPVEFEKDQGDGEGFVGRDKAKTNK